jgi:hypothetical protein
MPARSTREVFEDHLNKRMKGQTEQDIEQNYAEDVVLLTGTGIFRGREGVRQSAAELAHYVPDATFTYRTRLVEGENAFLEWEAQSSRGPVCDGADGFVIRDGRIVAQTIHYTVRDGA